MKIKYNYDYFKDDDISIANKNYFLNEILILSTPHLILDKDVKLDCGYEYPKGYKYQLKYIFLNTKLKFRNGENIIRPFSYNNLGTIFYFQDYIDFYFYEPFQKEAGSWLVPSNLNLRIEKMNIKPNIHPNLINFISQILNVNKKELIYN